LAACAARFNLPDGDAVLFMSATSEIVADLEMRGEGNLGGIWARIDTICPAGQAFSRNLCFAPSSVRLLCLEFVI
jgi:hypothetical protein